jgi:replication factor C small subunit
MNMKNAMWSEKYRPETLDEVVGQEAAVERLRKFLNNKPGELPHLLLSGPPGVGKTATVVSFAKEYYGDEFDSNFREFNASDDRGIDVIREDVKSWCRRAPSGGYPYKIIFLDEADQLTSDAQPALRRVMEQYSDSTRFALSCNYVNEIMGPLQSRCSTLHFGRVDDDHVREMIERIIEGEEIEASRDALDKVVRSARGQVRDAVLTLQTSVMEGELTEDQVELTTGVVDDQLTRDILELALNGELDEAQTRLDVDILKAGADPHALIDSIFRTLRRMDVPPDYRAKAFELLAEIEERIQHGLNPHVQFHALLAHLHMSQGLSPISQQAGGQ